MTLTYILAAAIAYLLGSIPFGYILLRVFRGEDVRQSGSGNIGATNVARKAPGLGILTLVLDAAKGYAAVAIAVALIHGTFSAVGVVMIAPASSGVAPTPAQIDQMLQAQSALVRQTYLIAAVAAIFAILGHIFPVWLKFKGGKGVATGVGSFLALAPKAVLVVLVIFVAVVAAFRYVSLASIVATATFPFFAFLIYRTEASMAVWLTTVLAALLIIAKHHQNIRRLLAGTESRFELKGKRA